MCDEPERIPADDDPGDVERVPVEQSACALNAWAALGPLVAYAIQRLGREDGLALSNALRAGALKAMWTLRPGVAECSIWKDNEDDIVYRFEVEHKPAAFVFVEVDRGQVN